MVAFRKRGFWERLYQDLSVEAEPLRASTVRGVAYGVWRLRGLLSRTRLHRESPDYSRWQSAFKAVAPGRLDHSDYDIADNTAPVGWRRVRLTVDEESALELPAETPWTPVIGSCDDYMPVSSWDWETARTLKADDTFDECVSEQEST